MEFYIIKSKEKKILLDTSTNTRFYSHIPTEAKRSNFV